MDKIRAGVLGATGIVGQHFVQLLDGHPWFQITALATSDESAGQPYAEACQWRVSPDMPAEVRDATVQACEPGLDCEIVFSALTGSVAGPVEESLAEAGYVVASTASAHRMDPDVPLLVPEVNPSHLSLIPHQQRRRGWQEGFIVASPNCSAIHMTLALKPLADRFGLEKVMVVTMQALSRIGHPCVLFLDIIDNVVPYIGGEEDKLETEPLKLLGEFDGERIVPAKMVLSAQANRVNTSNGHLEFVSVCLSEKAGLEEVKEALQSFRGEPQELNLPSAPARPIIVREEPDRPQPRFDRNLEGGMASVVGRLSPCPILDYKFMVLGHNTIRGAAGAALLNAELLVAKGYLTHLKEATKEDAVWITEEHAREMVAHAREGAPEEVCGALSAKNGLATRLFRARNAAQNPHVTYEMEPHDQLRIFRQIEDAGEELFGVYHSHPASPAYPSPTDVRLALYPEAVYFIVSLADPDDPVIRAFRIDRDEETVAEQRVVVE